MSSIAFMAKIVSELILPVARTAATTNRPARRVRASLCVAVLLALTLPALAKDSVPDWVRAAAALSVPHYSAETNAVVLLDDTKYTVAADGRAVEHHRRVVRILRPQGRNEGNFHVEHWPRRPRVCDEGQGLR
jgi:hypothetical protein